VKKKRDIIDAYMNDVIIPHCPACTRPCCGLTDVVLELSWKQTHTLYRIKTSREAFDQSVDDGSGPAAIRRATDLYYAHTEPCPAYDLKEKNCKVYNTKTKPKGCSDFPVYDDGGVIVVDHRCEAASADALQKRFEKESFTVEKKPGAFDVFTELIPRRPRAAIAAVVLLLWCGAARAEVPSDPSDLDVPKTLEAIWDGLSSGAWLDPQAAYWAPRRGERYELSVYLGGEGALQGIAPDRLPTLGGSTFSTVFRYYPVDDVAVVVGGRGYFGVDGAFAPGTTTSRVLTLMTGVRTDLVRENRFSLLFDFQSGPTVLSFADALSLQPKQLGGAFGAELNASLAMRYTLGPFTSELRALVGGRIAATQRLDDAPANSRIESGPFSFAFAGLELGMTWSSDGPFVWEEMFKMPSPPFVQSKR
jgi:Fe-S-cluster containining protein